jgi:hypothetical protein
VRGILASAQNIGSSALILHFGGIGSSRSSLVVTSTFNVHLTGAVHPLDFTEALFTTMLG